MPFMHLHASRRTTALLGVALLAGPAAPAQVPTSQPASGFALTPEPTSASVKPVASAPTKLPGPKYFLLRYNDDFRYLDGPAGSYTPDLFDPLKNIRLGEDWRLRFGGEYRVRIESNTNETLGNFDRTQDTYAPHRLYAHADLHYRELFRVFVETINARIEDRDTPKRQIDENRWDFHQLFGDVRVLGEEVPLTLRVGRQELAYGAERLISILDWANARRRFDGAKLFWSDEAWNVDVWYMRPIVIDLALQRNREMDHYDEDQHFYGAYATYKKIPNHVLDVYFLALVNRGDVRNANGEVGDLSVYTYGARFGGRQGPWDYDAEASGQFGRWAGDYVQAWQLALDGGYTLRDVAWTPRLGAGFDIASGDKNPNDESHGTFNQLFPLAHAYLGFGDQFARENIIAPNVSLTLKPSQKVTLLSRYSAYWAYHLRDALYGASGAPSRRNVNGVSGAEFGHEIDVTLNYAIDAHNSVLFGWTHFWSGEFVRQTGPSDNQDFFYLMYTIKF